MRKAVSTTHLDVLSKSDRSILEARANLRRLQNAVQNWRNNKDYNNCSALDTPSRNDLTENQSDNLHKGKSTSCLFLSKEKEFTRPLLNENNDDFPLQPMRKCQSEFYISPKKVSEDVGITFSELFEEATLFAKKGPDRTVSLASLMRSLSPVFRRETKHYTTPNESSVNSPRDSNILPNDPSRIYIVNHQSPRVEMETNFGQIKSDGSFCRITDNCRVSPEIAAIQAMDNCDQPSNFRVRASRVSVLPTITESSSRSSSKLLKPISRESTSSPSLPSPLSVRSEWKLGTLTTTPTADVLRGGPNIGQYAHDPSMSKCYLCEQYGIDSEVIFLTDGVRYNTPVAPVNRKGIKSELGRRLPPLNRTPYKSPYLTPTNKELSNPSGMEKMSSNLKKLKPIDHRIKELEERRPKWQSSNKMRLQHAVKPSERTPKNSPRCSNLNPLLNLNNPYNCRDSRLNAMYRVYEAYSRTESVHTTQLPPLDWSSYTKTKSEISNVDTTKLKQKLKRYVQIKKDRQKTQDRTAKLAPLKTPKVKDGMWQVGREHINVRIPQCAGSRSSSHRQ